MNELLSARLGVPVRYGPLERIWHEWVKAGNTKEDLELVLDFILWKKKKDPTCKDSLRPTTLLEPEHFEGVRCDAEAWKKARVAKARAYQPSQGEIVLGQFRGMPPVAPDKPVQLSREVLDQWIGKLRDTVNGKEIC